jgi:hypothetical protein
MNQETLPRFTTIPKAAAILGIGAGQLRAAVARGELGAVATHSGGWPRIEVRELLRWVRSLPRAGDSGASRKHLGAEA